MGALLESGMVGNIGLKHLKVIREDTIGKWDKLGFLEGLKGHTRENIAQLYENQATHLINEATSADASGSFETVVFPIVRRVFSKLLANDIVSVQAMNLPIGKLFYFVPKISSRRAGVVGNEPLAAGEGHYNPQGGAFGNSNTQFDSVDLYDQYYADGQGLWDRSKGAYTGVTSVAKSVAWNTNNNGELVEVLGENGAGVSGNTNCGSNNQGGVRGLIIKLGGFWGLGAGKLSGPSGNEMDTEEFLGSLYFVANDDIFCCSNTATTKTVEANKTHIPFRVVTQKYGKGIVDYGTQTTNALPGGKFDNLCDTAGEIYIELDTSCPACISCDSPDGYMGGWFMGSDIVAGSNAFNANTGTFTGVWRQYEDLEFSTELAEVSFDLDSVTVSVTERKLRAQWSPELAQDVSAFHNIDAEAELTALLSEEVAAEIDREILRDLRKGAAWDLRWDYNGWKRFSAGQAPYTQKDWNQTLITAINQISAQIHKSTLRGGANWIVCSSEVSAIFDDLEYFHVSNAAADQDQYNMGIEKIGTLSGRFTVYRDPYFPANQVLIGHKGTSLLDTGYVYAPYVPLQLTPTMYNPFNFTPIKGIMTRYAKKMVNNRFYGFIQLDGVRTFDIKELR